MVQKYNFISECTKCGHALIWEELMEVLERWLIACCSCRWPSLVPSTLIEQLTTTWDSNSRAPAYMCTCMKQNESFFFSKRLCPGGRRTVRRTESPTLSGVGKWSWNLALQPASSASVWWSVSWKPYTKSLVTSLWGYWELAEAWGGGAS